MISRLLAKFKQDAHGLVMAETAISLLILTLITLGGLEIGRYVLLSQKLDRVAATMGDLVSQAETMSVADLDNLFGAATHVIKPFSLADNGTVIVSSVSATGTDPAVVDWQRNGAGNLSVGSAIGIAGGEAILPPGMIVRPGEEIIVAEVYYDFSPWVMPDMVPATQLYHRSFFRPRQGSLTTLSP